MVTPRHWPLPRAIVRQHRHGEDLRFFFRGEPGAAFDPDAIGGGPGRRIRTMSSASCTPQAQPSRSCSATGVDRGYCLVVGSERGRLAYELAKRSQLRIYGIEADGDKVAASREAHCIEPACTGTAFRSCTASPTTAVFELLCQPGRFGFPAGPRASAGGSGQLVAMRQAVRRRRSACSPVRQEGASQPVLRQAISNLDFEPEAVDEDAEGRISVAFVAGLPGAGTGRTNTETLRTR
jgi:hypothetical protein